MNKLQSELGMGIIMITHDLGVVAETCDDVAVMYCGKIVEKADVKNAGAFRAALRAADFESTRGDFSFASNQHPIQSIYARQVIQEGDVFTNKVLSMVLENHSNAYVDDCKM